jgi:putative membrane protein (TIGR04086 family)
MESYSGNSSIINILKGVAISIIATLIFLLIFSIILTYTNISEDTIQPVIITLTAVSILIGSSIGNLKIKKNGILNGAIIGGLYFLAVYLISSIVNWNFNLSMKTIILILVGITFGIFRRNNRSK